MFLTRIEAILARFRPLYGLLRIFAGLAMLSGALHAARVRPAKFPHNAGAPRAIGRGLPDALPAIAPGTAAGVGTLVQRASRNTWRTRRRPG